MNIPQSAFSRRSLINSADWIVYIFATVAGIIHELKKHITETTIASGNISAALAVHAIGGGGSAKIPEEEPIDNTFPGNRELLQRITLSDGETELGIYMPNTKDMITANSACTKDTSLEFSCLLSAKAAGMEYKTFMELPTTDTQKIMEIVGKGFQIFRPINK